MRKDFSRNVELFELFSRGPTFAGQFSFAIFKVIYSIDGGLAAGRAVISSAAVAKLALEVLNW